MLTMSKVFKVYSVPGQAKLKGEGRGFWSGQAEIYPLNYLIHVRVMLTIMKVSIILFLLCLWE